MLKILVPISLLVTALAVGFAWDVHRSYGNTIEINGGRRMRAMIKGEGTPTVVFEQFGVGPLEAWTTVQPRVAEFTRTFSYDHACYWGSDEGPRPRDARAIATDLHETLARANIPPPYVLVGHSFGGPLARVFADLYPRDVAGMVLLDPTQEEFISWMHEHYPQFNKIDAKELAAQGEWGCSERSLAQAHAAVLPDVPLTLITAQRADDPDPLIPILLKVWLEKHNDWMKQHPRGKHIVLPRSRHIIQFDEANATVEAIREIVDAVRASARDKP